MIKRSALASIIVVIAANTFPVDNQRPNTEKLDTHDAYLREVQSRDAPGGKNGSEKAKDPCKIDPTLPVCKRRDEGKNPPDRGPGRDGSDRGGRDRGGDRERGGEKRE